MVSALVSACMFWGRNDAVLHHIALLYVGALIQEVLDTGQVPCEQVSFLGPESQVRTASMLLWLVAHRCQQLAAEAGRRSGQTR